MINVYYLKEKKNPQKLRIVGVLIDVNRINERIIA